MYPKCNYAQCINKITTFTLPCWMATLGIIAPFYTCDEHTWWPMDTSRLERLMDMKVSAGLYTHKDLERELMDQDLYIAKMKMIQKQFLFNLKELAEYFGVAPVTLVAFRKKDEKLKWSTLRKIKEQIDRWEESYGTK